MVVTVVDISISPEEQALLGSVGLMQSVVSAVALSLTRRSMKRELSTSAIMAIYQFRQSTLANIEM